jgi:TP901 family phage tail tape measure protein
MNIQVRVAANQAAAQLRALQMGVAGLNGGLGVMGARAAGSTRSLTAWGNQMQWTGRQLQTNWTLPLLAAGAAAFKWQMDNETAFTRISKVYGTAGMAASTIRNELEALKGAFEALSNEYGVQQKEVLEIAGDWAAAGASGVALAKGTQLTLQTMVLGEMKAADATQALIAIQAQYGYNTAGLTKIVATLNMVENETGVSMKGLIQGFQRSAGVARSAGVGYRQLAAMIAALSPAAGGAAEAGNALKTIFSRLASPTSESAQVLGLMGIKLDDLNWKSSNAGEQLLILSKKFEGLSDKQKEVVSTVIASRWQINKFSILMRELTSETGYYQKALKATSDDGKVYLQFHKELNTVLSSNPQRMKQIWVMLQNAMTDIIQPMIPIILYLANSVRVLVTSFSNLDPGLQKLILFGALALVMVGPILRYVGSLITLVASVGQAVRLLLFPFTATLGAMWTAVSATVSGISTVITTGFSLAWAGVTAVSGFAFRTIMALMVAFAPQVAAVISVASSLWQATWRAAWMALYVGGRIVWGYIQVGWAATLAWFRTFTPIALGALRMIWASAFLGLPAVLSTIGGMLLPLWTAIQTGLVAITWAIQTRLRAVWTQMWMALAVIQMTIGRAIQAAYSAMMLGIAAISSVVYPAISRAWYTMMTGIYIIVNAGNRAILATYRAMTMGLSGLTYIGGVLVSAAWVAITTAWQYILLGFTIVQTTLWRLWAFGLGPILASAGRFISGIWTVILGGLQRLWTMAWAGLVAIARVGSMLVSAVSAAGAYGIRLLAMAPAAMAGLFRAGWAALVLISRVGISGLISLVGGVISAIGWPVIAAIAAVVLLIAGFWDQIKQIWNNIVSYFQNSGNGLVGAVRNIFGSLGNMMSKVFNMLPQSVKNAMVAVVKLVSMAVHKVYELFSYLNPFAHHSPSLVENVTNGMAVVRSQFATLADVEKYVMSAYNTLQKFGGVANQMGNAQQEREWADQRKDVKKAQPSALPAFDAMTSQIRTLTPILQTLAAAVDRQQKVVDAWQQKLDAANAALDVQQKKLDALQKVADAYSAQLSDAKNALQDWADTPIKGQQAMSDAIFNNTMAQKKLQLQMMDMEKTTGPLDDIKSRMSAINGELDTLRGMRTSLAAGGAGSEILGVYDQQISKVSGQGAGLSEQAKALQDMQDQLDKLQTEGQRLDLENSLKFDPLTRQIEQASKSMKEMPFDTIMTGIQKSKADVDRLTKAYDEANKAVEQQQKVVDAATKARDAIQARYDAESAKLKKLKDAYDAINNAVQALNDSLSKMTGAASDAVQRKAAKKKSKKGSSSDTLSPGAQNFVDAAGGNFPDVGGTDQIGREGGLGDQSSQINDFTKDLAKQTSGMFAGLNPLAPLKKWWDKAWNWLKKYVGPLFSGLGDFIGAAFENIPNPFSGAMGGWGKGVQNALQGITGFFTKTVGVVVDVFTTLWGWIQAFWDFAQPIFKGVWDALVDGLMSMWTQIQPQVQKFFSLLAPIGQAFSNLWTILKPFIALIAIELAGAFTLIMSIIKNTLGPILTMIGGVIAGVMQVLNGVIEFIVGVFTLNWKMVWQGIQDIFGGVWNIIASIVKGAWNIVWGILKGAIQWLGMVFALVWEKVIKPAWNATWGWITKTASTWGNGIKNFFVGIGSWFGKTFAGIWDGVSKWWSSTWKSISQNASSAWKTISQPFKDLYNWLDTKLTGIFGTVSKQWKSMWKGLSDWFSDAAGWIVKPLKSAVNLAIGAVNTLIGGLNKVADLLPGLDWHISLIPKLATGGDLPTKRVMSGFKTTGARAIVGEGNPNHPEYVIPTDPMHKKRAGSLFAMLARDLGYAQNVQKGSPGAFAAGGIPMFGDGGILGSIKGALGDAGNFFKGLSDDILEHVSSGAATYIIKPFFKLVDPLINKIPWKFAKAAAHGLEAKVIDWITFADDAVRDKTDEGGSAGVPAGKLKKWILQALGIIKKSSALSKGVYNIAMHESGGNPRAINLTDSNAKAGHPSKGIMQTIDSTFNAYSIKGHRDIWNPIDNIIAGTRYAISRYGEAWLKRGGNKDKNGNYIGYELGGVLGQIPSLAQGAYIRRKMGGTLVRVGEGRTDEAVLPLPNGMDSMAGKKEYHFHGDLVFPNISTGEDAARFLENLEDLAAG